MVTINGESVQAAGVSIQAYLQQAGYDPTRVVVEKNLDILPQSTWSSTLLQDGDSLEILCFVGGG